MVGTVLSLHQRLKLKLDMSGILQEVLLSPPPLLIIPLIATSDYTLSLQSVQGRIDSVESKSRANMEVVACSLLASPQRCKNQFGGSLIGEEPVEKLGYVSVCPIDYLTHALFGSSDQSS